MFFRTVIFFKIKSRNAEICSLTNYMCSLIYEQNAYYYWIFLSDVTIKRRKSRDIASETDINRDLMKERYNAQGAMCRL